MVMQITNQHIFFLDVYRHKYARHGMEPTTKPNGNCWMVWRKLRWENTWNDGGFSWIWVIGMEWNQQRGANNASMIMDMHPSPSFLAVRNPGSEHGGTHSTRFVRPITAYPNREEYHATKLLSAWISCLRFANLILLLNIINPSSIVSTCMT